MRLGDLSMLIRTQLFWVFTLPFSTQHYVSYALCIHTLCCKHVCVHSAECTHYVRHLNVRTMYILHHVHYFQLWVVRIHILVEMYPMCTYTLSVRTQYICTLYMELNCNMFIHSAISVCTLQLHNVFICSTGLSMRKNTQLRVYTQ